MERTLLERIRRGSKMNRKQLSQASGVSYRTLFNIERRGYKRYTKRTHKKLAKALNISDDIILS